MNTMINMLGTTATAASGSPLAADRYRMNGIVLAHTGASVTGAVCPQLVSPTVATLVLSATAEAWGSAGSGTGAGRPADVRPISDFSKPRHGSQASDGSG